MKRLLIVATLALSACGSSRDSVQDFVANADAGPRGAIPALPESQQYQPQTYAAFDLRDPFVAPHKTQARTPAEPRSDPLEKYSLETLKMVGTVRKNGMIVALVKDPNGVVHQARPGNRMGQNSARITAITEATITLVEPVIDASEAKTREIVVNLVEPA